MSEFLKGELVERSISASETQNVLHVFIRPCTHACINIADICRHVLKTHRLFAATAKISLTAVAPRQNSGCKHAGHLGCEEWLTLLIAHGQVVGIFAFGIISFGWQQRDDMYGPEQREPRAPLILHPGSSL